MLLLTRILMDATEIAAASVSIDTGTTRASKTLVWGSIYGSGAVAAMPVDE
jgi:hypothetical protein